MRIQINNALPIWLFIFCVIVFARGLTNDFVMDDWPIVKENSKITATHYIPGYFTSGVWSNTDLAAQTGLGDHSLYRPLFLLTLNLSYQLWGDNSLGYHLLNLVIHSINTILVYFLIAGFLPASSRMVAGMSAAIFAVYPIHVESVSWIAGMTDPLVSLFLLGGFLLHRRAARHTNLLYAIGAPLCYGLALLCKETALFFPFILLCYDAVFQRKLLTPKTLFTRYASYALLLIAYVVLRANALDTGDAQQASVLARIDLGHWPTLFAFFTHYIKLLVLPWPLEFYYQPPKTGLATLIFGSLIALGALAYLPRALRSKNALYILAITWGFFTLLPALPIALFVEPVFAPRVLYLPSVAIALLMAWVITQAQRRSQALTVTAKAAASVILLAFAASSMAEIEDWENDTAFYIQAMKSNPDSFKPIAGLAAAYARTQNNKPAIDLYLKAAKLAPKSTDQLDYLENAARISGQSGDIQQSENLYNDIVHRAPLRSSAWVGLGNNALARNDQQQALEYYQKAYQADPSNRIASYNLALVYQRMGNVERAAYFQRLAQQP